MNRKELKTRAKAALKKYFWLMVAVTFVLAFVSNEGASTTTAGMTAQKAEVTGENTEEIEDADSTDSGNGTDSDNGVSVTVNPSKRDNTGAAKSNMEIIDRVLGIERDEAGEALTNTENIGRAVVADIMNELTKEHTVIFDIIGSLDATAKSEWQQALVLFLAAIGIVLFPVFVAYPILVGGKRFYLDVREGTEGLKINVLMSMFRKKVYWKTVEVMFFRWIKQLLWAFTIVGGIIKYYEYQAVPFLLAEAPNASRKEIFKMARDMMKGYKWKLFVLNFSFFFWDLLSMITINLVGIFYVSPYRALTVTEFYADVRDQAIARNPELYKPLTESTFDETHLIPATKGDTKERRFDYKRKYDILTLVLLFFIFCFIGYAWEVSLHIVKDHEFVNRGTLHGPWLPIYGTGGVVILLLLKKLGKNPVLLFFSTVVVCGIIEYSSSWYLWQTKHEKYWDYSDQILNLNGRICAEGLIIFGLGGCMIVYFAAPFFAEKIDILKLPIKLALAAVLLVVFIADNIYTHFHPNTGKGITDYAYRTEQLKGSPQPMVGQGDGLSAPRQIGMM